MMTLHTIYTIQRLRGLSTDTKPTDVPNGSEFQEMDTGKKFLYSAAGTEWIEQPSSGGSGGGGSVEPLIVNINAHTMDKTWQEIYDALVSGSPAYVTGHDPDDADSVIMYPILSCSREKNNTFGVEFFTGTQVVLYTAITKADYPTEAH